jgi:hypothetical protein
MPEGLACQMLHPPDMRRSASHTIDHLRRRKIVALASRIRGQWRYLVRSTTDPFPDLTEPEGESIPSRASKRLADGTFDA